MLAKVKRPDTISAEEAAKMVGVHKTTLIDYITRGWIEAYKVSPAETSPYRISRASVVEFIRKYQGREVQ